MQQSDEDPAWEKIKHVLQRNLHPKIKQAIIKRGPNGETSYGCIECPIKYDDIESLELHLCMHNNEYRYLCGICGAGLKRREHLERHTLEHKEVRPHVCDECGKAFKRKEHLNIHRGTHSVEKKESCTICLRAFHRKDHLQKHLQIHNKHFIQNGLFPLTDEELVAVKHEPGLLDEEPQMLDPLDFVKVQDGDMQTLMMTSPDPLRPFACCICSKTYKRKDHLKLHSLTHLEKDKICSDCGKGFHTDEQLGDHIQQRHIKQETPFYSIEDDLPLFHIVEQSADFQQDAREKSSIRPHECAVCHKRFKRKQHLRVHSNTHSKLSPIYCTKCHMFFHRSEEYACHSCAPLNAENIPEHDKMDVKIENISIMEDTPTSLLEGIPVPQRVFVCKECGKTFRRKDHYRIHLNVHTPIRNIFCTDCGKGFYRKDHLQKHMQVHFRVKKMKPIKPLPALTPINQSIRKPVHHNDGVIPEITIVAPSKLRVPLQMKVPYQVVTADGSVTVMPS